MNKLTDKQRNEIRMNLFEKVKNDETRSRIITIATAYSDETNKQDDLEKMIHFLTENQDRVEELYQEFVGSFSYIEEGNASSSKRKRD